MRIRRRRTWLFGPGADEEQHQLMSASSADVLILDFEDFTPLALKDRARTLAPKVLDAWRTKNFITAIRINSLEGQGILDIEAATPSFPDIILYPMASTADEMFELDEKILIAEERANISPGQTEIIPVCETALGVADVRLIAKGSRRIRAALLGAEDLVADLHAERSREGFELDYARRRFVLECRAAGIEPIDAPYTFSDIDGLSEEARRSKRLGYREKSLVRPEHAAHLSVILTPSPAEIQRAQALVFAFEKAQVAGKDRALLDGLWIEVPTYRGAKRLLAEEGFV